MPMNENEQEKIADAKINGLSNCCYYPIYQPDICSFCKEHCEQITEENTNNE